MTAAIVRPNPTVLSFLIDKDPTMDLALAPRSGRHPASRSFYLAMSLLLAGIAAFGFAQTVPTDFATPHFPLLLVLHGIAFTAWLALFVAQPSLIMARSHAWHRRIGWLGATLAVALTGLAAAAIVFALRANTIPPFYPPRLFVTRGAITVLLFAGLILAAVRLRRRPAWHARLMLCATIVVVSPGLERALPLPLFGESWPFVVDTILDLIALAGPAHDLATSHRIHPAYGWGIGTILLGQTLVHILTPTPLATALLGAAGTT